MQGIKDIELSEDAPVVPWFPKQLTDLDSMGGSCLVLGDGIEDVDHPTFRDPDYVKRRRYIGEVSASYRLSDPEIPRIEYNQNELGVWKYCYNYLKKYHDTHACKEYRQNFSEFEDKIGFSDETIPQIEDISNFLESKTGWRLCPVGGLLSQRDFLNGLAFKIFFST